MENGPYHGLPSYNTGDYMIIHMLILNEATTLITIALPWIIKNNVQPMCVCVCVKATTNQG